MTQERDDYMRRQAMDHDLLRMRDPKAPYGRNGHGVPKRPDERVEIRIFGDDAMAAKWAAYILNNAPVLDALPIPVVSVNVPQAPTQDAYLRACRALHWRTAQLKAAGIEPLTLSDDMAQYPPDAFVWPPVKHTLVEIGFLGSKRVYLDLTQEEAEARYIASEGQLEGDVTVYEIEDEFHAYFVSNAI